MTAADAESGPVTPTALPADAIDVWHLDLTSRTADAAAFAILSEDERARVDRFRVDSKRTQFVAARAQARVILARYVDSRPAELRFGYGEHGKPHLPDHPDLEFNLSHSKFAGLLGVTRGVRLGIDVEFEKPDRRFADLARRFFAESECAALLDLPAAARPAAFYRAWACKEAYLKAWGTGLSFPSRGFAIRFDRRPALLSTAMPGDHAPGRWHIHALHSKPGYSAAVCFEGERRWLREFG